MTAWHALLYGAIALVADTNSADPVRRGSSYSEMGLRLFVQPLWDGLYRSNHTHNKRYREGGKPLIYLTVSGGSDKLPEIQTVK